MKVVKTYSSPFKAELDKSLLENYGIFASVLDQNINMIAGMYNSDLLGIRLVVDDADYGRALDILEGREPSDGRQ